MASILWEQTDHNHESCIYTKTRKVNGTVSANADDNGKLGRVASNVAMSGGPK
jgi:hypothetical protein